MKINLRVVLLGISAVFALLPAGGCGLKSGGGYSNTWLYPEDISTVYVEMFDSSGFRRGHEFKLTDAICKRIESQTPYKIVSDRDYADTVLSGTVSVNQGLLSREHHTGAPLERETVAGASVTWKDLRNGTVLINNEPVAASASYSSQLGQTFDYSADLAVDRLAQKVVELMEKKW